MSWRKATLATAVLALSCVQNPAAESSVRGQATVVDGDSIKIDGQSIRLDGIDAPEADQLCGEGDISWPCGERSTANLVSLTDGWTVECRWTQTDRYKRILGTCTAGGVNINAAQVRSGLAVAYRRYSTAYVDEEEQARSDRKGMWDGEFDMPWDHRRKR